MARIPFFWKASFWILVLITLWLSLIPADQIPTALGFWDKAQHALGFAGLAVLGLNAYPGRIRRLILGLMLFGAGIELAQWLTGWRQGDRQDWIADCAGMLLGYAVWRLGLYRAPDGPQARATGPASAKE